jgi:hypothetical protein
MDDLQQVLQGFILAHPGGGAGPERGHDAVRLGRAAEHDDAGRPLAAGQVLAQAVRALSGQVRVEQDDGGLAARGQARRWRGHLNRGDDLQLLLGLQPQREGISEDVLPVDDKDADAHAGEPRSAGAGGGIPACVVTPTPNGGSAASLTPG